MGQIPSCYPRFRQVVKGVFYKSFDLNLSVKKGIAVYFTLVVFLSLVSLAISDAYPTYHQKNTGKNISKKRHFLYVNRIMQLYIWKQLEHHNSLKGHLNPFQASLICQYTLKISENWVLVESK